MQENANQNPEKERLLNKNNDTIQKDANEIEKLIGKKELEMAKKTKPDTDKLPSNLGGSYDNGKETGNLSDKDNDLGQEDNPQLGFFDKYFKPIVKKITDLTSSLVKDSRSLVDWMLGGASKGKPMNDPVSQFFSKLGDWLGINKIIKSIQDVVTANKLKDNIVPDGHKGSNLKDDKKSTQASKTLDPRLDFDPRAKEIGIEGNKDPQYNNTNNNNDLSQELLNKDQIKESNAKNALIADNKSSSSAQNPYQVDDDATNHETQSENAPMKYKMNQRSLNNARAERLPMPRNNESKPGLYNNTKDNTAITAKKAANVTLFDIDDDINNINNLANIRPMYDEKFDIELDSNVPEQHVAPVLGKHTAKLKDAKNTQPIFGGRQA